MCVVLTIPVSLRCCVSVSTEAYRCANDSRVVDTCLEALADGQL